MNTQFVPAATLLARRPRPASGWSNPTALFLGLLLLYNDVLSGVTRFVLVSVGLPQLFYAPFLAALAFVLIYYLSLLSKISFQGLLTVGCIAAAIVISLLLGRDAASVFFAFYIWTPFFVGAILILTRQERRVLRHVRWLWLLAVAGVGLNYFIAFPWTGTAYNVFGVEVQASLAWKAYEFDRIAGFSRGSFAAANQIAVFACLMLAMPARKLVKAAVWIVSATTIAITTSKTPLLLLIVVPVAMGIFDRLEARGDSRLSFTAARSMITAFLALIVGVPLLQSLPGYLDPTARISFLTLASFNDRIAITWPRAFALISNDRNPVEWLTGRGLGGIGTPQQFTEALILNPGDNLFVYLYVSVGLFAVLFAFLLYRGLDRIWREDREYFRFVFASTMCVLTLALTTNVIESVVPCLFLGMISAKGLPLRTRMSRSIDRQPFRHRLGTFANAARVDGTLTSGR